MSEKWVRDRVYFVFLASGIYMSENRGGGGVIDGFDGFLPVLAFFPLLRVS